MAELSVMADSAQALTPNALVAVNMRRLRRERDWTQEELGAKLGWSKVSVSAAERSCESKRVKVFSINEVVTLARIFGVPVDAMLKQVPLCGGCGNNPPPGFTCNACGRPGKGRVTP